MDQADTRKMQRLAVDWTRAQPVVSAFVGSVVGDFHQSEEILQRTAATVVAKIDQYDPSQPFAAWAIGIARIEVLRWRQERGRDRLVFDDETVGAIASGYESLLPELAEIREALAACIARLRGRTREVLDLQYGEQLPIDRVAQRLGTSVNAVTVALHRARRAVRLCMERRLGDALPGHLASEGGSA